jgi:hypothetical protein
MATELTFRVRDRVAKEISRMPDPDEFVNQALETALQSQASKPTKGVSKWARLVAEIESLPGLGEYEETLRRDQEEFRSSFRFKHDES